MFVIIEVDISIPETTAAMIFLSGSGDRRGENRRGEFAGSIALSSLLTFVYAGFPGRRLAAELIVVESPLNS